MELGYLETIAEGGEAKYLLQSLDYSFNLVAILASHHSQLLPATASKQNFSISFYFQLVKA